MKYKKLILFILVANLFIPVGIEHEIGFLVLIEPLSVIRLFTLKGNMFSFDVIENRILTSGLIALLGQLLIILPLYFRTAFKLQTVTVGISLLIISLAFIFSIAGNRQIFDFLCVAPFVFATIIFFYKIAKQPKDIKVQMHKRSMSRVVKE
ncbi:MAG: hypothetical protein WCG87_07835 [Bacteroidota bacterium]